MQELKKLYNSFLETGDLLLLYPDLVGKWEDDKTTFAKHMKPAAKAFIDDVSDSLADEEVGEDDEDV